MEATFVREVYARYRGGRRKRFSVTGPEDAARFVQGVIKDNTREHFVAVFLDGGKCVASFAIVSVGTANVAPVAPREVFQLAVLSGACSLIVAHNHPSGRLEPSTEDLRITQTLVAVGELIGIPILDHLIVSEDGFLSFKNVGRI